MAANDHLTSLTEEPGSDFESGRSRLLIKAWMTGRRDPIVAFADEEHGARTVDCCAQTAQPDRADLIRRGRGTQRRGQIVQRRQTRRAFADHALQPLRERSERCSESFVFAQREELAGHHEQNGPQCHGNKHV